MGNVSSRGQYRQTELPRGTRRIMQYLYLSFTAAMPFNNVRTVYYLYMWIYNQHYVLSVQSAAAACNYRSPVGKVSWYDGVWNLLAIAINLINYSAASLWSSRITLPCSHSMLTYTFLPGSRRLKWLMEYHCRHFFSTAELLQPNFHCFSYILIMKSIYTIK